MAIQLPDPGNGVPEDKTGDNEHVMWLKVKDNFSDQNNAASRLVGGIKGTVPLCENLLKALYHASTSVNDANNIDINSAGTYVLGAGSYNVPAIYTTLYQFRIDETALIQVGVNRADPKKVYTRSSKNGVFTSWVMPYNTGNTTKDSNGFIKAASPIVKVFADKVELNDDAASQNVTFVKNGVGDYTITTVSGLSTDGWYIELPKDINGNPKVAVTLNETDGVISLKCYKRIFSMETFTFVPDLDEPMDVPDGRWIDLRLNEIAADEPIEPLE